MNKKHTNTSTTSQNQPPALYVLFFTEMWERYGYYTMRAIMILYMTKVFLLSDNQSYSIFAAFTALIYLTPVLGGHLADRILGFKRSILYGGILMTIGYAMLALPGYNFTFYLALGTLIIGNGFFKPNVSGIVGELYGDNDPRRDGGFTIFYAGINVGSLFPPLVTSWVIYKFGWASAFIMSAAGVFIGLIVFYVGMLRHPKLGRPPKQEDAPKNTSLLHHIAILAGSLGGIILCAELVKHTDIANAVLFSLGTVFMIYSFTLSLRYKKHQRERLILCHILILFSVVFWALYQQAAMSLTVFTEYNVNRTLFGWTIPTILFQSVNPVFIIALGPLLSRLWLTLERKSLNPSIPAKFAWATILMGSGFILLPLGLVFADKQGNIAWSWIVLSYFLQTVGELLLSPVGLSMVTELSPKKLTGLMMGAWFFASALANALAGFISEWTTVPSESHDPLVTDPSFAHVFGLMGWITAGIGIGLLFAVPWLKKLMHVQKGD